MCLKSHAVMDLHATSIFIRMARWMHLSVETPSRPRRTAAFHNLRADFWAPLAGTSDEHKVGASMLSSIHYVYEMHTMKRFEDPILVAILQKMRQTGGAKLTDSEWQSLLSTELDAEAVSRNPEQFLRETSGWFESCYM